MKDACIYAKQSEIENFAGRVFMALNTLCCQNSETQLNDLESFIELMRCIYHREFDEAIEWFNKLTSTDKEKGWESKKYYLEKLFQYCSHTESVEMFKREFYTQKV